MEPLLVNVFGVFVGVFVVAFFILGIVFGVFVVAFFIGFIGSFLCAMDSRGWSSSWWIGTQIAADDLVEDLYRKPRNAFRRWRCKRAWQYLIKHDSVFRSREAGFELVRRRKAFYDKGGDPMSAECPDIWKVLKDWGFPE